MLPITSKRLTVGSTRVDGVPDNLLHRRKSTKRTTLDARQIENAIEQIVTLPLPGESLHFIVDGRFEPCDLIPATRRLSDPAIIKRLDITTLGANADNVECIARGMDQGKIQQCLILVSGYYCRIAGPEFQFLKGEIESRGGKVHAMGTHAKIMLMEMSDGNFYTIEGSGNLRSCGSIEQFVMTNDRDLLMFHRKWIEDYVVSCGGKDKTTRRKGVDRK